jgi:hypothetical protein
MKRLLAALVAVPLVVAAVLLSRPAPADPAGGKQPPGDLVVSQDNVNPWTHLQLNNAPSTFRFAIVSDNTGGPRDGVFEHAIGQLNLLQPEFVVSVGDLINGQTEDPAKIAKEWKEMRAVIGRLEMPFFFIPGNHDISNTVMEKDWQERFGRRYYHFVYKNVLFVMLNAEDLPGKKTTGKFGPEQVAAVKKILADNKDVRWTLVFLHRPLWHDKEPAKVGWTPVEEALQGRKYTVFCGHEHVYQREERHGMRYYTLATTGGKSKLRGAPQGEFDHIVWVTMKDGGPVLANLMMEGIFPEDVHLGTGKKKAGD